MGIGTYITIKFYGQIDQKEVTRLLLDSGWGEFQGQYTYFGGGGLSLGLFGRGAAK
jgi:hypothetical protein